MHVAIFHKDHPFSPLGIHSGAEMATIHLARALARAGIRVTVLGRIQGGDAWIDGVRYLDVGPDYRVASGLARLESPVDTLVAVTRGDVVVESLACSAVARRFLWLQDSDLRETCASRDELAEAADGFIYVSRALRDHLEQAGLPSEKGAVIPNGYDPEIFFPSETGFDPGVIVYAGALLPEKGVDLLIEAFHLLSRRRPEARLALYGSAELWGRRETFSPERFRALNRGLLFAGNVGQRSLAAAFRRAAVVVLPSRPSLRFEPFPLTSIEAQASGAPVVVSRNGGLPEGIVPGTTGFVTETEDPRELADVLFDALSDSGKLERMRRAASEHVARQYRWDQIAESYLALAQKRSLGESTPKATRRRAVSRKKRIAVFYVRMPQPDRFGGDFRAFRLIRALASGGHDVVLVARDALDDPAETARYRAMYEALGVEVHILNRVSRAGGGWHATPIEKLEEVVGRRSFDAAWILWWNLVLELVPQLRRLIPAARLVADSVDVAYLRLLRQASVTENRDDWRLAAYTKRQEHLAYGMADRVITVTEDDRRTLQHDLPEADIRVVPNVHAVTEDPRGFDARRDLLFVGFYEHLPNTDAALYFVRQIFPRVQASLPGVKLYLVGNAPPKSVLELASDDVIVTGYVPDLTPYWQSARLSLAPLRYGAGMKGKIGQSMAEGLPVVTTSVGAEGMGLTHEHDVLIADTPEAFAEAVIRAYTDTGLWERLSRAGIELVASRWSDDAVRDALLCTLTDPAVPEKADTGHEVVREAERLSRVADGYEWLDLGCPVAAREVFEDALERWPGCIPAALALAELEDAEGQPGEAERLLRGAVSEAPNDVAARARLGRHLCRRGHVREAVCFLESASADEPENPLVLRVLASLFAAEGDDLKAGGLYRRVLEKNPHDAEALDGAASILARQGDLDSAHRLLLHSLTVSRSSEGLDASETAKRLEAVERRIAEAARRSETQARAGQRAAADRASLLGATR